MTVTLPTPTGSLDNSNRRAVDAGLIADDRSTILRSVTRTRDDRPSPRGLVRLDFNMREFR